MERRTFSPKQHEVYSDRKWYIVDAEGKTLGRLASVVAQTLRGKGKPTFAPHVDVGDFVVVINANKVVLSGKKETQKFYYRHSNYPGGLKKTSVQQMRLTHPDRIIEFAVRGMLPRNLIGERQLRKLKIYAGPTHPHASQQPHELDVAASGALQHSA